MLRRDVDEAVVAAAAHTPFEARHRVFVLERADTMNDEAANALLKTLEEPPAYVVLLLLTDRPEAGAADDRLALPARALRPAAAGRARRAAAGAAASAPAQAAAAARLSLGDGERALALALGDGAALRARAEAFARAPLHGRVGAERPWAALLEVARGARRGGARGARGAAGRGAPVPARARSTSGARPRSASRRAAPSAARDTAALDHALQLAGCGTATSRASPPARPSSPTTPTGRRSSRRTPRAARSRALRTAIELVDDTRARLALNVSVRPRAARRSPSGSSARSVSHLRGR